MAKQKRPSEANQRAKFIIDLVTGYDEAKEEDKKKALSNKGVSGGLKGGVARANKLTKKGKRNC